MTLKEIKQIKLVYDAIVSDNTSKLTNEKIKNAYQLIFQDNASNEQSITTIIRWVNYNYNDAYNEALKLENAIFKVKSFAKSK